MARSALGPGDRRAREPEDRPDRQAAPVLGARRDRRRHARGDLSADGAARNRRSPTCGPRPPALWASENVPIAREPLEALLQDPRAVRPAAGRRSRSGGSARPRRFPPCCRCWPRPTSISPTRLARRFKRIDDWKAAATGLDSPDPKVRAGVLLAMEQVYDVQAARALARFASSVEATGRGADEGARVSGRGPSQGAALGRPMVGHAAG